jgi:ribosomal protein S18 acetylase RimI-like enzyme
VGFVAVGFIDEDATRAGEIHMIAVDPAHQGAGVGDSLMQRAVTEIKAEAPMTSPLGTSRWRRALVMTANRRPRVR